MGREIDFPRRCQAFGQDYSFAGQMCRSVPISLSHGLVQNVVGSVQTVAAMRQHNGLLVNWYDAAKKEYIGPHSDDEGALVTNAPIFSLSLCNAGHYRRFRMTCKRGLDKPLLPKLSQFDPGIIPLFNGSLIVMGGTCQATHKHEVMPTRLKPPGENIGHRVNLTLRAFKAVADSIKRQREEVEAGGGPSKCSRVGASDAVP